jgi:hypothetical protein
MPSGKVCPMVRIEEMAQKKNKNKDLTNSMGYTALL